MIVGSGTAVGGILLQQSDAFDISSLWLTFGTMAMAAASYLAVSLAPRFAPLIVGALVLIAAEAARALHPDGFPFSNLQVGLFVPGLVVTLLLIVRLVGGHAPVDMDRLLHRGKYADDRDRAAPDRATARGIWKWFGMGHEFTIWDRVIYIGAAVKAIALFGLFIVFLVVNLLTDVSFAFWLGFWRVFVEVFVVLAIAFTVWFTIGGILDIRFLYRTLATLKRDEHDDGSVAAADHLAESGDGGARGAGG